MTRCAPFFRSFVALMCSLAVLGATLSAQQTPVLHPTLSFTSYLLGPLDRINAVAASNDGSVYVTGVTLAQPAAFDPKLQTAGEGRAFVAKFSPDGSRLIYLTYLSSSGPDDARSIAVDATGNAYVAGTTRAHDFTVVRPIQPTCQLDGAGTCAGTAFVAKVDARGQTVFATYFGGTGHDEATSIAADVRGNMVIAGSTHSLDFPVKNALQQTASGNGDAFVTAIAADGSRVLFSTYFGGSDSDEARAIALDQTGNIYLTGKTTSLDFPIANALQARCRQGEQSSCTGSAFVAKISSNGKSLVYSTYLGGSGSDAGNAIAVDARGSAYVAGVTSSPDFPTANAIRPTLTGQGNAFVSKLSPEGSSLIFSTYVGGSGAEQANAVAVDRNQNVLIAGWTYSPDFPVQAALQSACAPDKTGRCGYDSFLASLNANGDTLRFSSYLGGTGADVPRALALDSQGSAYLAGWTTSHDFPQAKLPELPDGVSRSQKRGSRNLGGAFVAKVSGLNDGNSPTVTCGGTTKNWVGTVGDNLWQTGGNWSPSGIPVSTDNVCIPTSATGTITVGALAAANQTIASLVTGAPVSITSGPLTISGTGTFTDLTTQGTLFLNATTTMTTLHLNAGVVSGPGDISISGLFTWQAGSICTNFGGSSCSAPATQSVVNANGGISITGSPFLQGRTLNNPATATYTTSGSLQMFLSAVVNNPSGGIWDVGNNGNITVNGTGNTFNNAGTFRKTSGTANSIVDANFNNTGVVQANSGTLQFRGGGDCGSACPGTWTVGASGNLQFPLGTWVLTGDMSNNSGGSLNFNGGVLDLVKNGTTTITGPLNMSAGVVFGPATLNITGLLTWQGGSFCTNFAGSSCSAPATQSIVNANGGISFTGSPFLQGRTLNNPATTTYTAATSFQMFLSAIVNNPVSGVWDLGNNGNITVNGTGNTFNNQGTLRKTSGTANSLVDAFFNNLSGGTVQENSGTLQFRGGGDCGSSCPGTWTVGASGNLQFPLGTWTLTGDFTNNSGGTLTFNGGNLNLVKNGTTTITGPLTMTAGVVFGPATLNITGLLTWQGGSFCTNFAGSTCSAPATQSIVNANGGISFTGSPFLQGRTLNNPGSATYTGATSLQMFLSAIVNNPSGGVWDLGNNGNITVNGTGNTFNNSGIVRKTSGTANSLVDAVFNNLSGGTVQANSGALLFRGGGDCGSSCPGGWTVGASGNLQFPLGTWVLTSDMTNNSGGTLLFNGGNLNFVKNGTTTINGPLNVTAGVVFGPATLNITGLLTWQGGSFCTNFAGSTCSAPATQAIVNANGGISFTGSPFLQGRTLNNPGTASYTGALSLQMFLSSIVNNLASGTWDLSNNANITVNGTGNVFNNAGTLKKTAGTGTSLVDANVTNTGIVQVNSGNVSFRGTSYTQTAGSTSMGGGAIQFTNPALEQAGSFTGAGTITGTLNNSAGLLAPNIGSGAGNISLITPGAYMQGAGAAYNVKIGGKVSGQYDSVTLAGAATLNGALNLSLINGFVPNQGDQFVVMTFASKTGQFSSVSSGWSVSYTTTSAIVTFNGGGGNPIATLSPTKVKFSTQVVSTTAKAKKITLSNTGTASLLISSIAISPSGEFTQTNTCGAQVDPGKNCVITTKFKPSDKGNRSATLTITDNASPGTQTVPLTGVGTYLSVTPNPVAFAAQLLNTTSTPLTIVLQNTNGTTPITVSGISLTGSGAGDYTQDGTCNSVVIPANGNCTLTMTFKPSVLGKRAATLKILEDGGGSPLGIKVSGSGTNVTLSPSPAAFGSVTVGSTKSLSVTLTNHSPSSTVAVSSVSISGTNKGDFTASKDAGCNSVPANGGTCTITVNFKPAATGSRNGLLTVKDSDAGSPQTDVLTGTGQ